METRSKHRKVEQYLQPEEPPLQEPEEEEETITVDEEHTVLSPLSEDAAAFLRIKPAEGRKQADLQEVLKILNDQQAKLREHCSRKLRLENDEADRIRDQLLTKLYSLPKEFLDEPADDASLSQIKMPSLCNMPSVPMRNSHAPQQRVVRVLNRDSDADLMLTEWSAKFDSLSKALENE